MGDNIQLDTTLLNYTLTRKSFGHFVVDFEVKQFKDQEWLLWVQ